MNTQLNLSKALERSSFRIIPSNLICFKECVISWERMVPYKICLPSTYPNCSREMSNGIRGLTVLCWQMGSAMESRIDALSNRVSSAGMVSHRPLRCPSWSCCTLEVPWWSQYLKQGYRCMKAQNISHLKAEGFGDELVATRGGAVATMSRYR